MTGQNKTYKRRCKWCGVQFETEDKRKIYCTREHGARSRGKRHYERMKAAFERFRKGD